MNRITITIDDSGKKHVENVAKLLNCSKAQAVRTIIHEHEISELAANIGGKILQAKAADLQKGDAEDAKRKYRMAMQKIRTD